MTIETLNEGNRLYRDIDILKHRLKQVTNLEKQINDFDSLVSSVMIVFDMFRDGIVEDVDLSLVKELIEEHKYNLTIKINEAIEKFENLKEVGDCDE